MVRNLWFPCLSFLSGKITTVHRHPWLIFTLYEVPSKQDWTGWITYLIPIYFSQIYYFANQANSEISSCVFDESLRSSCKTMKIRGVKQTAIILHFLIHSSGFDCWLGFQCPLEPDWHSQVFKRVMEVWSSNSE